MDHRQYFYRAVNRSNFFNFHASLRLKKFRKFFALLKKIPEFFFVNRIN